VKVGGKGGGNTVSGAVFEKQTDLKNVLENLDGITVRESNHKNIFEVVKNKKVIGQLMQKYALYKFLKSKGIDYKTILSKKLLPDECYFSFENSTLYIGEKKYQNGAGSVDEKLQTCDFKKRQYKRLVKSLDNVNVEYFYVLNDFFNDAAYRDVLSYIEDVGCRYYFNKIPLDLLGFNQ
jgi:hypothetical protein